MKRMKKAFALMLAMVMSMALAVPSFAVEGEEEPTPTTTVTQGTIGDTPGSITLNHITIEDGKPAASYKIYQILKLDSFDTNLASYKYSYTNDLWKTFLETTTYDDGNPETTDILYIAPNDNNILEWKAPKDSATVEKFAQLALKYAQDNRITPTMDTEPNGTDPVTYDYTVSGSSIIFEDLELGYYLVDSSVGVLCGLSTTNPDGLINSKNGAPSIQKAVREDLSQNWGTTNSADIGQDVDFRVTIHVHDGAQNYVLHDTMEAGFTFKPESVNVKFIPGDGSSSGQERDVDASNYEVVTENLDGCTFQVVFKQPYCDALNTNDRLFIYYTAMLNRNADIGNSTTENPANENKALLAYGDNHKTPEEKTTTTTYAIDLVKTDGQNKLLDGSEFKIYSAEDGGSEVTVVPLTTDQGQPVKTDDGYNMYRKARSDEAGATVIVVDGKVRIIGLDNGVYWLEETEAPDGFNPLSSRQKFTISDNNLDAIITNGIVSTNSGVQVINHSGSMLPETGGMGTVMFITCGSIVVMAAGVLLVTKKRMSMIQD